MHPEGDTFITKGIISDETSIYLCECKKVKKKQQKYWNTENPRLIPHTLGKMALYLVIAALAVSEVAPAACWKPKLCGSMSANFGVDYFWILD